MTFVQFIDMLENRALWFSRIDQLYDPREGRLPTPFEGQLKSALGSDSERLTPLLESGREGLYVNCWHASPHESMAMWELYSQRGRGIAVRCTVHGMKRSLQAVDDDLYVGEVTYLDSEKEPGNTRLNILVPCFQKDRTYRHEQEARVAFQRSPVWSGSFLDIPAESKALVGQIVDCLRGEVQRWGECLGDQQLDRLETITREALASAHDRYVRRKAPKGISIAADLDTLIEEIVVGPKLEPWVEELIRRVARTYRLQKPIQRSRSLGGPDVE